MTDDLVWMRPKNRVPNFYLNNISKSRTREKTPIHNGKEKLKYNHLAILHDKHLFGSQCYFLFHKFLQ